MTIELRKMQRLQFDTVSASKENIEMEERLQRLKESMNKEKEQRGQTTGYRWMSGQFLNVNLNSAANKQKKEKIMQKLSEGKVKIRVLKPELLTAPLQPPPPPSVRLTGPQATRRRRLKETICGQSAIMTPGKVLHGNDTEDKQPEVNKVTPKEPIASLLCGEFDEDESAKSFQNALKQWRGENINGEKSISKGSEETLVKSEIATQVDLLPNEKTEGQEIRVQFSDSNLTYMDRLLLKQHRRSPTQYLPPPRSDNNFPKSPPTIVEDSSISLTAEEEDFHLYCASLFTPTESSCTISPGNAPPESCLVIEVLDDTVADGVREHVSEEATDPYMLPSGFQINEKGERKSQSSKTAISAHKTASTILSAKKSSREPKTSAEEGCSEIHQFPEPQSTSAENPVSGCYARNIAVYTSETSGILNISVGSPTPMTCRSPTIFKSKPSSLSSQGLQSPLSQPMIPMSLQSQSFLFSDFSELDCSKPAMPEEHSPSLTSASPFLRSTFTVTLSGSAEATSLPEVYCPIQFHSSPNSSFSQKALSSQEHHIAPKNTTKSPQLLHYGCSTDNFDGIDQDSTPLLEMAEKQHLAPPALESGPSIFSFSPGQSLQYHRKSYDSECGSSSDDQNAVKAKGDSTLSTDSEDEMSSDSLSQTVHDEASSGDEAYVQGHLFPKKSLEKNNSRTLSQENHFTLQLDETKEDFVDETKQDPEQHMVIENHSAGPGSERFCDLNRLSPLGLEVDTGHAYSPEQAFCDGLSQTALHDLEPTGSIGSKSPQSFTERIVPTSIEIGQPKVAVIPTESDKKGSISSASPFSRAAQEIMDICSIDQTGCEDPDIDLDIAAHMVHSLEQDFKMIANGPPLEKSDEGHCENQNLHGQPGLIQDELGTEGEEEEEQEMDTGSANKERQCVLFLP